MTEVRLWLMRVMAVSVILSILSALMPKGKWEAAGNITASLVLLAVMLRPLTAGAWDGSLPSFDEQEHTIERYTQDQAAQSYQEWSAVISERTGAYIQEKGTALGLTCQARVSCTEQSGVPFPTEVWLDIPFHPALSAQISEDLAIDPAHQHWQEETS